MSGSNKLEPTIGYVEKIKRLFFVSNVTAHVQDVEEQIRDGWAKQIDWHEYEVLVFDIPAYVKKYGNALTSIRYAR